MTWRDRKYGTHNSISFGARSALDFYDSAFVLNEPGLKARLLLPYTPKRKKSSTCITQHPTFCYTLLEQDLDVYWSYYVKTGLRCPWYSVVMSVVFTVEYFCDLCVLNRALGVFDYDLRQSVGPAPRPLLPCRFSYFVSRPDTTLAAITCLDICIITRLPQLLLLADAGTRVRTLGFRS